MELSLREKCKSSASEQDGVTLIEMMIAMVVLAVGILGAMSLVITAISGDGRSKQQSNSTALTQMVTERIMAVAASNNTTVTIADCTGTIYNLSTTGSSSGTGASLTSSLATWTSLGLRLRTITCPTLIVQRLTDRQPTMSAGISRLCRVIPSC